MNAANNYINADMRCFLFNYHTVISKLTLFILNTIFFKLVSAPEILFLTQKQKNKQL